jgi:Holliday junction resolvase
MEPMVRINPKRDSSLGQIGERLAVEVLVKASFKNVRNLNDEKRNYPFADIYAERDGKRYVLSVKTRNKYTNHGKINDRYKVDNPDKSKEVSTRFGAVPAFLTISIEADRNIYSGYFGEISMLRKDTGVPMRNPDEDYECLGKNVKSEFDLSKFTNAH